MKNYLIAFTAAALLSAAPAAAQKARLIGGLNLANVSVTDNGRVDDANMLTSFQLGVVGDFDMGGILFLQPGVIFTGKGTKS